MSEFNTGDRVRVTIVLDGIVSSKSYHEQVSPGLRLEFQNVVSTEVEILERAKVAPKVGDPFTVQSDVPVGTVLAEGATHHVFKTADGWRDNFGYLYVHESSLEGSTTIVYLPEEAK